MFSYIIKGFIDGHLFNLAFFGGLFRHKQLTHDLNQYWRNKKDITYSVGQ